jgi:hypothetical protein
MLYCARICEGVRALRRAACHARNGCGRWPWPRAARSACS